MKPTLETIPSARFQLNGEIARRLAAVTRQWILPAPFANPAMLEMFRNRDRQPYQSQMPWAGEFAGKYLTHAVQIYRLTRDKELGQQIDWFVGELVALQAEDGYLGPWPKPWRLRSGVPDTRDPWDAWGHYHVMTGLLLWYQDAGDKRALKCARRIGDLFCNRFLGNTELHDTGCHEMNQAPAHSLVVLHQITGEAKYLVMAKQIVGEWVIPPAGDYLRRALAGDEFWETPRPRWESLHPIMALVELYYVTGEKEYRQAFEHLWWSMCKGDRHNNGGFTSGERATGNPYDKAPIETCCTVAWMAMSVEMLRLTGNPIVADELELAMFNSGLGMMSPSGRWVTYNTPMDGERRASAHDIVFQAKPGSPELNCCSVNGPRALGMLCEWAVMARGDGLALNYYGPGTFDTPWAKLTQQTDYPRTGKITIAVKPKKSAFTLALRIPQWSKQTKVRVNGQAVVAQPGTYLELNRKWKAGDKITFELDFRLHYWAHVPIESDKDLELDWRLFGPVPRPQPDPDKDAYPAMNFSLAGITEIPATLNVLGKSYSAHDVKSAGGIIDCRALFPEVGGLPVAYAFAEWHVKEAQTLHLVFAADWWMTWYLNGECASSNAKTGNGGDLKTRNNWVTLHLCAGRNLLAFELAGGSAKGAWFSVGRELTVEERAGKPREYKRVASIYRGPILLAFDPRHNIDHERFPMLDADKLKLRPVTDPTWLKPWMLFETNGPKLRLCDFASAGAAGNTYKSWLPVRFPVHSEVAFSGENTFRSFRV
ncbi:MAG: hypothetical protein PCFJNLEI_04239 [Verrucomicrobiae bacterium]|nr:hypothetical protein [Verrucomicrobiae bacterium]